MSLFEYPKKCHFGRVLPKAKIYEYAGANARLKELFVKQIDQIVWKCKLAPETINIPATRTVSEIQVFEVTLRTKELREDILRAIDKAIPFPILYEVRSKDKIKAIACYKRPSESNSEKWVVGSYFATEWFNAEFPRQSIPIRLNMGGLYEELLGSLIPYQSRDGETLYERVERAESISSKKKELVKAQAALAKEKQFNRKVEINAEIRSIEQQIHKLTVPSGK